MNEKAIELKVKNFLESFKNKYIYSYAITLSPVFKEPERYIDYRKQLAQLLIAVPKLAEYDPKSLIFSTAKAYEQGYSFDPKDEDLRYISDKEWQEIQIELSRRKKATGPAKSNLFFVGLLRCGKCGSAMVSETGNGGKYFYYVCGSRRKHQSCGQDRLNAKKSR